jgi:glycosyltransferase involved in cell wall biosynthesis
MRIAQVAPLYEAVPPKLYGGTERVVAHLCNALHDLGHEVTLFASAEAQTRAVLHRSRERSIRLDPRPFKSDLAAHLNQIAEVHERASEFDVLHFHIDMLHFPFFEPIAARTVTTLHGRLDVADLPHVYRRWSQFPLVSISDSQRAPLTGANWVATVHHGVDPELFAPTARGGGYLAFLGRISPEKRPDRAIDIAKRTGSPLRIAAKVDAVDRVYFAETIEPMLQHPLITYVGEIGDAQKAEFLGDADVLLFPIDWPEPFGLAMIEAMACGTPVVAYDAGAAREVVETGRTGFVVHDEDEAVAAVARARRLDRREVRRAFDERFTASAMARRYLQVYRDLAGSAHPASTPESAAGRVSWRKGTHSTPSPAASAP